MRIVTLAGRELVEYEVGDPEHTAYERRVLAKMRARERQHPSHTEEEFWRRVELGLSDLAAYLFVPLPKDE